MSLMIDALNKRSHEDGGGKDLLDDEAKRTLRMAALLHDVGHYPLSHATEASFFRCQDEKDAATSEDFEKKVPTATPTEALRLNDLASQGKNDKVSHERFGQLIITKHEGLTRTLKGEGFDEKLIGYIVTAEIDAVPDLWWQLIHSSLDADRLDFLQRDSHFAGVSYGLVDLGFIVANLILDPDLRMFAVNQKAIPAFEHFLLARYFMYNVYYHKTVMGFELMAKTLFSQMAREKHDVVVDFDRLIEELNNDSFFLRFDDDYFWRHLHEWDPHEDYYREIRRCLLSRIPLTCLFEERQAIGPNDHNVDKKFQFLRRGRLAGSSTFVDVLKACGIDAKDLSLLESKLDFERMAPVSRRDKKAEPRDLKELGKVCINGEFKDLIDVEHSAIRFLSHQKVHIRRLYLLDRTRSTNGSADRDFVDKFRKELVSRFI